MSDAECAAKGIPDHLHQVGRDADPAFTGDERLFRRFPAGLPDLTAAIRFERMSVNRGKYCETADDALWNDREGGRHEGFGVMAFPVKALELIEKHFDPSNWRRVDP